MQERTHPMMVFSGNSNRKLAKDICAYLNIPLGKATVSRFLDGEVKVIIDENVRGKDVYVVQSTCQPVNDNLIELLVIIDALKRACAYRVTAVIPYFGYARQDRKHEGRVPITAKLVANMIVAAGADRILTMDLHATQIQGFFDIPVDHLFASAVFIKYFKKKQLENPVIVCPDIGSSKMGQAYAKRLDADLAVVDKRRTGDASVEVIHLIGEVKGKSAIIVDDMVSTAGTITQAARLVKERGAEAVYLCVTHQVLCGPAVERLKDVEFKEFVITDSVLLPDPSPDKRMKVLSVASLLGEAIEREHKFQSVSSLFV